MSLASANALSMAKYGTPVGVSRNAVKNQSYVTLPNGNHTYVGPKPTAPSTVDKRITASTPNAATDMRASQQQALDQLKAQSQYDSRQSLYDFNTAQALFNANEMAKKQTIPGYVPQSFDTTQAYQDNRINASNINATYNTDKEALKAKQDQEVADMLAKQRDQILKQIEARTLLFGGNSQQAQADVLADRRREAIAQGKDPNTIDTTIPTLNSDYLKSINLLSSALDANGNPIPLGMNSTNYNVNDGSFNISQAQRNDLKTLRSDVQNGKYDDLIAQGYFSPSSTGIIGYDGKPVADQSMTYGGNLYQGNDLGGFNYVSPIKAPTLTTNSSSSSPDMSVYQDMMSQFTNALQSLQQKPTDNATTASATNGQSYSVGPSSIGVSGTPTLASAKKGSSSSTTKTVGGSTKYTVPSNTSVRLV